MFRSLQLQSCHSSGSQLAIGMANVGTTSGHIAQINDQLRFNHGSWETCFDKNTTPNTMVALYMNVKGDYNSLNALVVFRDETGAERRHYLTTRLYFTENTQTFILGTAHQLAEEVLRSLDLLLNRQGAGNWMLSPNGLGTDIMNPDTMRILDGVAIEMIDSYGQGATYFRKWSLARLLRRRN